MTAGGWEGGERRPRSTPPLAVVVVVVALAAALLYGRSTRGPDPLPVEQSSEPPVSVAYESVDELPQWDGTWRRIAPAPLAGRVGASATWTGEAVMVWGGVGATAEVDGALYDPARDSWREVRRAPLSARYGHAAVWDGDEVVVAGGRSVTGSDEPLAGPRLRDAAAYNPTTGRWRALPSVPFETGLGRLFAVAGRLYAVAPLAQPRPVAVLDAGSAAWRLLPAADWPAGGGATAAAAVDAALMLWPSGDGPAVTLDLRTQQWSPVAHRPRARAVASCECDVLAGVVVAGRTDVIVYDAAAGEWWRVDIGEVRPSYAGGPEDVLFLVQAAAVTRILDRTSGSILAAPAPPENLGFHPAAVWAGDRLFMWSGVSGLQRRRFDADGLTFTPAGRAATAEQP